MDSNRYFAALMHFGAGRTVTGGTAVAVTVMFVLCAPSAGCRSRGDAIGAPFFDGFDTASLASWWRDTGGHYQVREGQLVAANAYNHPLWLRKRLPAEATLELDVQSRSAAGDIKFELFGDGESFDPDRGGYVSSGYVLIFGGWHNSLSVICRNDEHDAGRKAARADRPVQPGRTYHMRVTRKQGRIDWQVDGAPFLEWTDPQPLAGAGHEYFGVNDWESEVHFDNLSIRPAE